MLIFNFKLLFKRYTCVCVFARPNEVSQHLCCPFPTCSDWLKVIYAIVCRNTCSFVTYFLCVFSQSTWLVYLTFPTLGFHVVFQFNHFWSIFIIKQRKQKLRNCSMQKTLGGFVKWDSNLVRFKTLIYHLSWDCDDPESGVLAYKCVCVCALSIYRVCRLLRSATWKMNRSKFVCIGLWLL